MEININYVPPPPYEPPPALPRPIKVRVWTWVWICDDKSHDHFSTYPSSFEMKFEREVRDVCSDEVVGEFLGLDLIDEKLYARCTLTRAYESVSMSVTERDEQGYETGKYRLVASAYECNECPLQVLE